MLSATWPFLSLITKVFSLVVLCPLRRWVVGDGTQEALLIFTGYLVAVSELSRTPRPTEATCAILQRSELVWIGASEAGPCWSSGCPPSWLDSPLQVADSQIRRPGGHACSFPPCPSQRSAGGETQGPCPCLPAKSGAGVGDPQTTSVLGPEASLGTCQCLPWGLARVGTSRGSP